MGDWDHFISQPHWGFWWLGPEGPYIFLRKLESASAKEYEFVINPSLIPGAGNGLFYTGVSKDYETMTIADGQVIPSETVLMLYRGSHWEGDIADLPQSQAEYMMHYFGNNYVDAGEKAFSLADKINHNPTVVNCEFMAHDYPVRDSQHQVIAIARMMMVVSTRDIHPGEELFIDYNHPPSWVETIDLT